MRILILILVVILVSCSSKENNSKKEYSENFVNDTSVSNKHETVMLKENSKDLNFNISKYKQGVDSLLEEIVGEGTNTRLLTDTLTQGDLIFTELKKTPLNNIVQEAISVVKYSFPLVERSSRLKHCLTILTFSTRSKSDSVFSVFKNVALEKSGIPGLTYTSDYLVQVDRSIYWINSNCSYSYENHLKFVSMFEGMINTTEEKIKCECGKVICTTSE